MSVQTQKKSTPPLPWPALIPLGHHAGKPAISLQKTVILVGSRHNAHLHLLSRHVSKAHALVLSHDGNVYIRDLASREGIYLNGVKKREAWLKEGDLLKIGTFTFKYKDGPVKGGGPKRDKPPQAADLEVDGVDEALSISDKVMLIGRRSTCDVSLIEASVSTAHAVIFHVGGKRYIRDLGSRTGTFVDGKKIHQHELTPGATVKIGETEMRYVPASQHEHAIAPAPAIEEEPVQTAAPQDLIATASDDFAIEVEPESRTATDDPVAELARAFGRPAGRTDRPARPEAPPRRESETEPEPEPTPEPAPTGPALPAEEDVLPLELVPDSELLPLEFEPQPPPQPVARPLAQSPEPPLNLQRPPSFRPSPPPPPPVPPLSHAGPELELEPELEPEAEPEPGPEPESDPADTAKASPQDELIPLDDLPQDAPQQPLPVQTPAADDVADATWAPDVTQPDVTEDPGHAHSITSQLLPETHEHAAPEDFAPVEEFTPTREEPPAIEEPAPAEAQAPVPDVLPVSEDAPVQEQSPVQEAPPLAELPAGEPPVQSIVASPPFARRGRGRKWDTQPESEKPKRKRGRKSKKDLEAEQAAATSVQNAPEQAASEQATPGEAAPVEVTAATSLTSDLANDARQATIDLDITAPQDVTAEQSPPTPTPLATSEPSTTQRPADELRPLDSIDESEQPQSAKQAQPPEEIDLLDEVEIIEDEQLPAADPGPGSASAPDSGRTEVGPHLVDQELPLLDLESADLPPVQHHGDPDTLLALDGADLPPVHHHGDPDTLLALDQIDPEKLDEIDVIEPTDPAPESAFEAAALAEAEPETQTEAELTALAPADIDESSEPHPLTDNVFAEQVDDFTATSTGDLVEEQPLSEEVRPEEVSAEETPGHQFPAGEPQAAAFESADAAPESLDSQQFVATADEQTFDAAEVTSADDSNQTHTTTSVADPALGATIDSQSFVAETGDADVAALTREITPGIAEPEPVLDDQAFVNQGEAQPLGQDSAETDGTIAAQTFTAPQPKEPPPTPPTNIPPQGQHAEPRAMIPAPPPPEPPGAQPARRRPTIGPLAAAGGLGGGGGFVIGSDLSSFIGGMPLNLPDVAPPPPSFGRVQVSFAGAKAPWERAARPGLPMGTGLAGEVMAAAQGLRDVEQMDPEQPPSAQTEDADEGAATEDSQATQFTAEEEESVHDEGAPADEWNIAEALDFEDEEQHDGAPRLPSADVEPLTEVEPQPRAQISPDDTIEPDLTEPELTNLTPPDQVEALEESNQLDLTDQVEVTDQADVTDQVDGTDAHPFDADAVFHDDLLTEDPQASLTTEAPAADESSAVEAELPLADLEPLDDLDEKDAVTTEPHQQEQQEVLEPIDAQTFEAEFTSDAQETPRDDERQQSQPAPPPRPPSSAPALSDAGTIDELTFDEPPLEGLADAPRLGAIDEAVAELEFTDEPTAPVVDRSPPPPVPPHGVGGAGKGRGGAMAPPHGHQPGKSAAARSPQMVIPPPPARGPARGRRAGETGGGAAAAAPHPAGSAPFGAGPAAAPFAAGAGVRQMDVFAQSTALEPADASVFGGEAGAELNRAPAPRKAKPPARARPAQADNGDGDDPPAAPAAAPPRHRTARNIVPPRMAELSAGPGVAAAHGPTEGPFGMPATASTPGGAGPAGAATVPAYPAAAPARNVRRTALIVVVLMILCFAAAFAGIWYWIKPRLTSEATLQFKNFGSLTKFERDTYISDRNAMLIGRNVLTMARSHLLNKGVPLGFLDASQIERLHQTGIIKTDWESRPGTMIVQISGDDGQNDPVRLDALMLAMYQENAQQNDRAIAINAEIEKLKKSIAELDDLNRQAAAIEHKLKNAPTESQLKELHDKVKQAETQWKLASAAFEQAKLEVERAEKTLAGTNGNAGANANTNDAATPAAAANTNTNPTPAPADTETARLQQELEQAISKLSAAKGAASDAAEERRKALDRATESFQLLAAGMARDNPDLAQYIASAQRLQQRIQRLGNELLTVQQDHFASLTEWQRRMNEQVQARRVEIWANDRELTDLNSQMALAQRGYNALVAENYAPDSKEVKEALTRIKDLNGRIESRKNALAAEPVITKYTEGLQELIQIARTRLEADKAKTEKEIKEAEQEFAQGELAQRLTEGQKAQAALLRKQQHAINEMRQEYAAALEKKNADSNQALKSIEGQITDLKSKLDERQRYLASEGSKKLNHQQEASLRATLTQKKLAMKSAEDQAAKAWELFYARQNEVKLSEKLVEEVAKERPTLEAIHDRIRKQGEERRVLGNRLEASEGELKHLVTVVQPGPGDRARVAEKRDDRWLYIAGSWLGIAVLFGVTMVVVSASGGDRSRPQYHPLDAEPLDQDQQREELPVGQ